MFGLGFLDAIGAIAKKLVQGIVDIIVFLFTHPMFLAAVIIAIVGGYLYIKNAQHIHFLEQEIVKYEQEKIFWVQSKAIYESNIRLLTQVDKENSETLKKLESINLAAIKARENLAKANAAAKQKISNLENYIKSAPPSDNGAVAPVLKRSIEEIDRLRVERNNLWRNK